MAVNTWDEDGATLADFARENKLRQRILLNGSGVGKTYGVSSIPANVWINSEGVIADADLGFDNPKHLEAKTRRLLGMGN